jgi:hypothetical protein
MNDGKNGKTSFFFCRKLKNPYLWTFLKNLTAKPRQNFKILQPPFSPLFMVVTRNLRQKRQKKRKKSF